MTATRRRSTSSSCRSRCGTRRRGAPPDARSGCCRSSGPAFIACVAYIDPGNFATNIAGGSKFGYTLVWVIVASNLMAMLIQTLSAKLGIATGRNLPEVCRDRFSRRTSILLWLQAEAIAMATDLAEFLGAAIGFHLLFGIEPLPGGGADRRSRRSRSSACSGAGFRPLEAAIAAIVGVIGACYLLEIFMADPPTRARREARRRARSSTGSESVLLAVGILGATVMPHVIYLHSALTQNRIVAEQRRGGAAAPPLHADRRRHRDVDRRA